MSPPRVLLCPCLRPRTVSHLLDPTEIMLPDISPITADDPGSGCTLCYEPDNDEVRSPLSATRRPLLTTHVDVRRCWPATSAASGNTRYEFALPAQCLSAISDSARQCRRVRTSGTRCLLVWKVVAIFAATATTTGPLQIPSLATSKLQKAKICQDPRKATKIEAAANRLCRPLLRVPHKPR